MSVSSGLKYTFANMAEANLTLFANKRGGENVALGGCVVYNSIIITRYLYHPLLRPRSASTYMGGLNRGVLL